ncbi:hypothetical protein D1007_25632 [Hordeum vulgare]|nr:hypothetical protein D1007_25632 [Hordeum vulgare]
MEDRLLMGSAIVDRVKYLTFWTHLEPHAIVARSLYDDILEVRIYFDAADRLEMKLCSSDVTCLNIVGVMETQGFSVYDLLYHIENPALVEKGLEMVENNAELQLINEPPIYAADQEGIVFESQTSSSSAAHGTGVCTQERKNVKGKLKAVLELEEEDGYEGSGGSDWEGEVVSDGNPFYMGDADDIEMEEGKRQREYNEIEEEETYDEGSEEEEVVHYEGDTEVEELFQMDEDDKVVSQAEDTIVIHEEKKKKKNKNNLPARRGPTTGSHSSVLEKEEPEFIPSSDEEEKGLFKGADDDGFEPLSFVLPKKRKSRAKQRPPRKWYKEKMEQPHEQLCLKMCFKDQHQFTEALLNLHITQGRNFKYHINLDQRIIVKCKQEHFNFFMLVATIEGETIFVIKKMRIEHTCPISTETTRLSAKWLADKYESLFRSDITTGIGTLIDACMEKYGVNVPKSMAYRAKHLSIDVGLGEHKKQYRR